MIFTHDDIGKAIQFTDGPRTRQGVITRIGGTVAEVAFRLASRPTDDPQFIYLDGVTDRQRIVELEGRTER